MTEKAQEVRQIFDEDGNPVRHVTVLTGVLWEQMRGRKVTEADLIAKTDLNKLTIRRALTGQRISPRSLMIIAKEVGLERQHELLIYRPRRIVPAKPQPFVRLSVSVEIDLQTFLKNRGEIDKAMFVFTTLAEQPQVKLETITEGSTVFTMLIPLDGAYRLANFYFIANPYLNPSTGRRSFSFAFWDDVVNNINNYPSNSADIKKAAIIELKKVDGALEFITKISHISFPNVIDDDPEWMHPDPIGDDAVTYGR